MKYHYRIERCRDSERFIFGENEGFLYKEGVCIGKFHISQTDNKLGTLECNLKNIVELLNKNDTK